MKNLYKQLKIERGAPIKKIQAAIERCNNYATSVNAKRVLLQQDSRKVYDRNHELLTTISKLRSNLGLQHSHNWSAELREEFTKSKAPIWWTVAAFGSVFIGFTVFWNSDYWQFEQTKEQDTIFAYEEFLKEFRSSEYEKEAESRLDFLRSEEVWERLESRIEEHSKTLTPEVSGQARLVSGLNSFIEEYGETERSKEAEGILKDMRDRFLEDVDSPVDANYFLGLFPEKKVAEMMVDSAAKWGDETQDLAVLKEIVSLLEGDVMDEVSQPNLIEIRSRVRAKCEQLSFDAAMAVATEKALREFILKYPSSFLRDRVEMKIAEVGYENAIREGTEAALERYISEYPSSHLRENAERSLTALHQRYRNWPFVRGLDTEEAYQRYLKFEPNGIYAETARRRLVDLEVDEILKGKVGQLPDLQPLKFSNRNQIAEVEVKNDTAYTLTVRYSGTDSQKHVIPPRQTVSFSISKGKYRVAASVDAKGVIPYAGSEDISYDRYGSSFYIRTTQF